MNDYWRTFWEKHAKSTVAKHPQCQVLRTLNKEPVGEIVLTRLLEDIEEKMKIQPGDDVLDLCCGNGWITMHLASKCKHVTGVDFTQELLDQIDTEKYPNISVEIADIRKIDFRKGLFDKAIIYAGIQYLSYKETEDLFKSVAYWLKGDGLFFIGDILDSERRWNFFNTRERAQAYFDSVRNENPILGTWFSPEWLTGLGKQAGFQEIATLSQSNDLPGSHYRFDMILRKRGLGSDV